MAGKTRKGRKAPKPEPLDVALRPEVEDAPDPLDPHGTPPIATDATAKRSRRWNRRCGSKLVCDPTRKCKGTTKKGTPCQRTAFPNGYCAWHGGKKKKPTSSRDRIPARSLKKPTWAASRGLYCDGLFPEEQALHESLEIGTLEQEIKLIKVQLRRAVAAQLLWCREQESVNELLDEDPDLIKLPAELRKHLEVELYERKLGVGADGQEMDTKKLIRRKRNYMDEIRQLCKLIAGLESAHKLIAGETSLTSQETVDVLAVKLREFEQGSAGCMPLEPEATDEG